jgi:hypothetical protein
MVIPAGTYHIGGGGGGGGGGDGGPAPEAPNPRKIQAYCVDSNRGAPSSTNEFRSVFAPQDAVTVSVGNTEYSLQEAINSDIVDIYGTQNDLDVRIFNLTQNAVNIEVHQNVVVGEATDTPYGLPLNFIHEYDFSSSAVDHQDRLWQNIELNQLRQLGYEVDPSLPLEERYNRAYNSFIKGWDTEHRLAMLLMI